MSPPEKLKKTNFGGNPPRAKATAASQSHRREPKPPLRAKATAASQSHRREPKPPPRAKVTAAYANQAVPFPSLMPSSLSACRPGRRQKGQQKNSKNTADFA